MKVIQRRCVHCKRHFQSDPRSARFQRFCSERACRRARQRRKLMRWRALHPNHAQRYAPKARAWAKAYPDYWRRYRAEHSDYRERERRRMAAKRRRQKRAPLRGTVPCRPLSEWDVANETAMRRVVVEKLRALDALEKPGSVANETPILRRVLAIEDCLRSTVAAVCVAKQTAMDRRAGPAP